MIYGIGIDIVYIPKFKKALERWGDRFTNKIFTQNELIYCGKRRFSEQHLAARFAAKEAFLKALGKRFNFTDIEVLNNLNGKPELRSALGGSNPELRAHLTISHDGDYCIAHVILETKKEDIL